MTQRKVTWAELQSKISQTPLENPKKIGRRLLSQIREINEDSFVPKTAVEEETEAKPYLTAFVFHPEAVLRMFWDILGMVLIIYQSISVPFRICFSVPIQGVWMAIEFGITLVFMMDVLVSFNTGFYSRGALVMNRKKIAQNYLAFWFWLDLLASFPYTWFIDGVLQEEEEEQSSDDLHVAPQLLRLIKIFRFLRILKLLRLAKLKRILIKIEDYIASNTLATLFVFFRLLSVVFFIAHWNACWWFYIGAQDMATYPITWVTSLRLENKSNADKYITSLYWAFTTMTTVGYGDIVPHTVGEKLYAMFSMIVACGVFAYTVGSIGSLVSKQNAVENAYREQVVAVNRYMRKKELPHELQFRVRRYLEYVWENKKKNNLDEKQILSLLSEPLRDDIYGHIHGAVIKHCQIFSQFEVHFISQVTRTLASETYAPGDTVIEEGEMSTNMYFIQNGKIEIYHHATKSPYIVLAAAQYFGEIALFTEKPRCASAKCQDFVDLLSLSKASMNLLLEKFPEAKETIDLIAKHCEDGDFSSLLVHCYICKELGHVAIRCKKILVNWYHDQTRKKWLDKRRVNQTVYIRPNSESFVKPQPKMVLVNRLPSDLREKANAFSESYINSKEAPNNPQPGFSQEYIKPRYTMIFEESDENSDEDDDQDSPVLKSFRSSVVKPEEKVIIEVSPFSVKKRSRVSSKIIPVFSEEADELPKYLT